MTAFDDAVIAVDDRSCCVRAHAKLNVTLEVLRRRDDGFHEVAIVMRLLELHDVLALTVREDGAIRFTSTAKELEALDPGENLCIAAAAALKKRFGVAAGVDIELDKRIPMAAGLGGGSSDAAAVLGAASRVWRVPAAPSDLLEVAASLGLDVPFFLVGGLALCEGRGERVRALPARWPASMRWLLLVKPAVGVSTAAAYRGLPATAYSDGRRTGSLCRSLQAGGGFDLADLENGMAASVLARYPEVARAREALLEAGAPFAGVCGTGATVFAPFERLESALQVRAGLLDEGFAPAAILLTQARGGRA